VSTQAYEVSTLFNVFKQGKKLMEKLTYVNKKSMTSIIQGAGFLASGGGGPIKNSMDLLGKMDDAKVSVVSIEEAASDPDNKLTLVVAFLGSPDAMATLQNGNQVINAFNRMQTYIKATTNKEIGYLIPVETGAISMLAPYIVAANNKSLKIVDGDGAGRAVPSLTMLTYSCLSTNPSVMASTNNEAIVLEIEDAILDESFARPILSNPAFNESAGFAIWPMDTEQLKKANPVPSTFSLAYNVGKLTGNARSAEKIVKLLQKEGLTSKIVFSGVVKSINEVTTGGFDFGTLTLTNESTTATVFNQNENLLAWSRECENPIVMSPDSICFITAKGQAFSNADINELAIIGQPAYIIGVSSHPNLRDSPEIMNAFSQAMTNAGYSGKEVVLKNQPSIIILNDGAGVRE
jgi:DUF917 family protein